MRITITIPDELATQARARGLTPESYVEHLMARQAAGPPAQTNSGASLVHLEKFFEDMAAHSDKIPRLPDEAFTRDSFYRDHD